MFKINATVSFIILFLRGQDTETEKFILYFYRQFVPTKNIDIQKTKTLHTKCAYTMLFVKIVVCNNWTLN